MKNSSKIYIYKTLLFVLILASGLLSSDYLMPAKTAKEKIERETFDVHRSPHGLRYGGLGGTYNTFIIYTKNYKFEPDNFFYFRVLGTLPITIYYSPIFRVVEKVEGVNSDNRDATISCETNSIYSNFIFIPIIIFLLSSVGMFIRNENADQMFIVVIIFFLAVLALAIIFNYEGIS